MNSVTLGDYTRPVQISYFIKDLFAGFQLLNLKNDILRKRSDGIKYSVRALTRKRNIHVGDINTNERTTFLVQMKKVEDVVYDLSLRNLIPKGGG